MLDIQIQNFLISEDPALAISPVSYNLKDDISIFQASKEKNHLREMKDC